jgi:hypothetical protein
MASPAQIAANRLNSRKSTGPTTPQGRAKSSMNALKHGDRSRKLAFAREESGAFEERLRTWMAINDAQNDVEEYLMEDSQRNRYAKAVRERWPDLFLTRETGEWRQILLALTDRNIERLNAKLEVHEQNADAQAERTFAWLSFDPSPEGATLRNDLIKCTNALFRGMANYRKYQAKRSGGWDGAGGVGPYQDRSEGPGPMAHARDGSGIWADDSFGLGDGLDDRLGPANVIDPDGVERHGDEMNGTGEIGEGAPSEANFAETMSIVEAQEFIQVAANPGALSGLDNGVAQPGKGSTPEEGEAPGSGSASGDPKPPTPDSSDRVWRGSSSATVSRREKRRKRRDTERRAVERMVEDKLKAGGFSPGDILMSVLALPRSGGCGP